MIRAELSGGAGLHGRCGESRKFLGEKEGVVKRMRSLWGVVACGGALVLSLSLVQCSQSPTESDAGVPADEPDGGGGTTELPPMPECVDGVQPSGALYRICMPVPPTVWNGDLALFAHGYTSPADPLHVPENEIEDIPVEGLITVQGYAYAATSYRDNGLVVPAAVDDLVELVGIFAETQTAPKRAYLIGASEGGLVTTLAVEQRPDVFSGGVATCGPTGDFRAQIDFIGDFRTVFEYFFPEVIPGSPVEIPQEVIERWRTEYVPKIVAAITTQPGKTEQLIRVTGAPVDPLDLESYGHTVLGVLWYNVFATNDAVEKLGGQPFDNTDRVYAGSDDDADLNRQIQRFEADPQAVAVMETQYQTSGLLSRPLVNMHTIGDEIVPYWHVELYDAKVGLNPLYLSVPVDRYGHCNFTVDDVLGAFDALKAIPLPGAGD